MSVTRTHNFIIIKIDPKFSMCVIHLMHKSLQVNIKYNFINSSGILYHLVVLDGSMRHIELKKKNKEKQGKTRKAKVKRVLHKLIWMSPSCKSRFFRNDLV